MRSSSLLLLRVPVRAETMKLSMTFLILQRYANSDGIRKRREKSRTGNKDTSASSRHKAGRRIPLCAEAAIAATDREAASIPRDAVERTSASAGPAVCSGPTRIWERTAFAKDQKRMLTSDMPLRAERPGTPLPESMRGVLFCHPDCQDVTGRQLRRDNSSHARRRSVRTD